MDNLFHVTALVFLIERGQHEMCSGNYDHGKLLLAFLGVSRMIFLLIK